MRGSRLVHGVLWWLVVFLTSWVAGAQNNVRTQLSARTTEVGRAVQLQLAVATQDGRADNPRLKVPQAFVVTGPSLGTQQQISIVGGTMQRSVTVTATWTLTPNRPGKFSIGPGSFRVGRQRVEGEVIELEVREAGSLPDPSPRFRSRPPLFDDDLFPGLGRRGSLFDELFGDREPMVPTAPAEYHMNRAPDPRGFLRAVVTPRRAVIGEQVTLTVYAYGALGQFNEAQVKEPRHPDFLAHPVVETSAKEHTYQVQIDGRTYWTKKIREIALFPLKAGDLDVGPMTMHFYGHRYMSARAPNGLERTADAVQVHVEEPPVTGRPPGYQTGDVGDFRLTAEVRPRQVEAGGAVSVVATLSGTGRLPATIQTPERKGIEWLEPSTREEQRVGRDGSLGGSRTFTYVVRLAKAGEVDLGELTLPFFSRTTRRYLIARARLGKVTVLPGKAPVSESMPAETVRLSEQFEPRAAPLGEARRPFHLSDQPWFFPALLVGPGLVVTAQGAGRLWAAYRRRRKQGQKSPEQLSKEALREAEARLREGKEREVSAAVERALFSALDGVLGVKARGLLRTQLSARLAEAGASSEETDAVDRLLARCDEIRFGGSGATPNEILSEARRLLRVLNKLARRRSRSAAWNDSAAGDRAG